jgi:hypothetical protein
MKSIIYLSDYGDRPCTAIAVTHPPELPAYEQYRHHDPRYTGKYYSRKYVCTIPSDMGIHQKINRRAQDISRTAGIFETRRGNTCVGRDYQWYPSPERIARSRFRKAKRDRRTGRTNHCPVDFYFGLGLGRDLFHLTPQERSHIAARLVIAATSRAPLTPWRLCDCWPEAKAA